MCNCIKEIEDDILNNLSNKNDSYKDKHITKVNIENVALMFNSKQSTQISSPLKIEYDKANRKGVTMHKKETINISYSYCPFCGKKYEE